MHCLVSTWCSDVTLRSQQ
uniref:Uncharacterized protein n=1 Tax=Anguilla anguilla TaxID=7936 RepID=A0A0E9T4T5_ANGAN